MLTRALLCMFLLAALGCACDSPPTVDVGPMADVESGTDDALIVDAVLPVDAPLDVPSFTDAPYRAPICGFVEATSCPTQRQEDVSACMDGEGAVFFDGAHCQATSSPACGAERGAFRSFEECAVVCEAAGHCDASKLAYTNPDWPAECETPSGLPNVCSGGVAMMVDEPMLIECEAFRELFAWCDDNRPHRCGAETARFPRWEDVWTPFRRASLLPFVRLLECDLGGP